MNEESFLYHHGVKGMKWGHRKDKRSSTHISRKERKQMNRDRNNISRDQMGKARKKYDVDKKWDIKEKRAQKVYDKTRDPYKISEDRTYQKLNTEYENARTLANRESGKKTKDILIKKYGKEKVDKLYRSTANRATASTYGTFVGAPLLTAVLGGAYLYSKYKK